MPISHYNLPDPTHSHACTLRLPSGKVCDRVIGPYYEKKNLIDAIARHRAAQHANTLERMRDREPGDARIKAATGSNPGYEPPNTYHGRR